MPVPYTGDGMLLDDLDIRAVERFVELAGPDSGSQLVSAEIRHVGGALRRSQPGHGALATLDAEYMTFGVGMVMGEGDHAQPSGAAAAPRRGSGALGERAPVPQLHRGADRPGAVLPGGDVRTAPRAPGGDRPARGDAGEPPDPAGPLGHVDSTW